MPNLFKITASREVFPQKYTLGEIASVSYHDIFEYPLTLSEMIKWRAGEDLGFKIQKLILSRSGYYFIEGKEGLVYKKTLRKRISERKMKVAKRASKFLTIIPTIKMVAVTGSLAMENSDDESDIDFMIVTKSGYLWLSRLASHFFMRLMGFNLRKAGDKNQKDKLCMNMWLDETDLRWRTNRNIYTAHEIAQVLPIVNKDNTYERFLFENKWILKFWPNSVKIGKDKSKINKQKIGILEKIAYKLQVFHMRNKRTRETVTQTRALFHPQDWSEVVLSRFSS